MYDRIKENSTGQLVFSRYMIPVINQIADWKHMCYHKQEQIKNTSSMKNIIETKMVIELCIKS